MFLLSRLKSPKELFIWDLEDEWFRINMQTVQKK